MPFSRPTLTTLRTQAMQDITASDLPGADGLLRRSALRVLAWVQAGLAHLHYGFLDWISRMAVPFTAEAEFLEAWAALKGVTRKAPSATTGTATFAGTNGVVIPAATAVNRSDNVGFVTGSAVTIASGSAVVSMTAAVAGSAGNFDAGTVFTLAVAIAGVSPVSTSSAQVTAGTDLETDDSLRTRMLQVYAAPPQGGDRMDYIEWALSVPAVTRAWIAPMLMGPGSVSVYVMMDVANASHQGFPQGTNGVSTGDPRAAPATGDQLTVANAILPVQPVTALVYVNAPIAYPVNVTVADLGANNTAAMQSSITAALVDMFLRLGQVGGTVDPTLGTHWPPLEPSDFYTALAAIPGLADFDINAPVDAVTSPPGNLPVLGTVTFVT